MSDRALPAAPLKEMFNATWYRGLASQLAAVSDGFDRPRFLELVLRGHDERMLMARMRQTAIAAQAALPGTYLEQLQLLRQLAPRLETGFSTLFLAEFVARFGAEHFAASMDALRFFTRFGSAEFAVRTFLHRDLERSLKVMQRWAQDADEHVRRLASEGSRPRLPWGLRLTALVKDPTPTLPILERLKADPSLYVRKSVANHLNDLAKDHPAWVLARLKEWGLANPPTAWIARHAARTMIKQGNPTALKLFGVRVGAKVETKLKIQPAKLSLGQAITLEATLTSTAKRPQRLLVDYVVHYARAKDRISVKVFKWAELDLAGLSTATLTKRQTIRDFTTRRHYAGRHRVELQVNGRRLASSEFTLRGSPTK
jgi:3-methyladenine DNA glycosylase AlkC